MPRDKAAGRQQARRIRGTIPITLIVIGVTGVVIGGIGLWQALRARRRMRLLRNYAHQVANLLPDVILEILDVPLGDDVTVPPGVPRPGDLPGTGSAAQVAEALQMVHDTALDLAVEQAVLRRNIADSFVNLGRRNQNLLGRMLDFLTEREAQETDPEALVNLFRLDHLATRMRRNAESLLVLAGIDSPRKWAAPVPILDLIRASLGEIEDYQRVTVRDLARAHVAGGAAADLAHLLAELIENAVAFSAPDQTVDIRGRYEDGSYVLAIVDAGLGMPPDEVARSNRRLAGAEAFTISPSKYLGHYVAGYLAARHGVTISLHSNEPRSWGLTAVVSLPQALLVTVGEAAVPDDPTEGVERLVSTTSELPGQLEKFTAKRLVLPGHLMTDVAILLRRIQALRCQLEAGSYRDSEAARAELRDRDLHDLAHELIGASRDLERSLSEPTRAALADDVGRPEFYLAEIHDIYAEVNRILVFLSSELFQEEYGSGSAYRRGRRGAERRVEVPDPPYVPTAAEEVDVDLYIDSDDEVVLRHLVSSLDLLANALGYKRPDEHEVRRGSFFRRARAKPGVEVSSQVIKDRWQNAVRAFDLHSYELTQGDYDSREAGAVAALLAALASTPTASVRVGSILIAKYEGPDGPVVQVRTLSLLEMEVIGRLPEIQTHPAKVFDALAAAVDDYPQLRADRRLEAPPA